MHEEGSDTPRPWPVWKIALVLYPFAAGAGAVNLFFLGLLGQALSLTALAPVAAVLAGLALGVPLAWIAARWIRRLIAETEA